MSISRGKATMMAVALAGAGLLAMGTELQARGGSSTGEVRLRCNASLRRGPEMGADWRSIDNGTRTRFSVEVADLANTSGLAVQVGAFTAAIPQAIAPTPGAANGVADLNLDTQDGQMVPALKAGDQVNVLQNGVGLLSCFLR